MDPITLNALRYSLSVREYKLLHQLLISRAPVEVVRKGVPPPAKYERSVNATDDYNAAAIRASLRVFAGALTGLKLWELFARNVLARGVKLPYDYPQNTMSLSSLC